MGVSFQKIEAKPTLQDFGTKFRENKFLAELKWCEKKSRNSVFTVPAFFRYFNKKYESVLARSYIKI